MRAPITSNPLRTRTEVQEAVRQLCSPVHPYYSEGHARVRLGLSTTNYGETRCAVEAFARPLWGLMSLAAGGGDSELLSDCVEGIANGTNPKHPEYWGVLNDSDQLAVEMPAIALSLALAPKAFWEPLSSVAKKQTLKWLAQINERVVPDSNWQAFPILVNIAMKQLGAPYDVTAVEHALSRLEAFYLGEGWYSDGVTQRRDYYVPFGIHFSLLIFARLMEREDPLRSRIHRERAAAFAEQFRYWFSSGGEALPFGRSLTYRFAQGAFWGALAFAGVEALPWGEIKGLYLRHLRHWLRQPICSSDGLLSIGYSYPNSFMGEYYNGPGSPYWALKAFLPLALPPDHPFWSSEERKMDEIKPRLLQRHPFMLISRSSCNDHVVALTSGQWALRNFGHIAEKYSKFAYSTHFGFSVARDCIGLAAGAYDSMLALSDGNDHWRVRQDCVSVQISDGVVSSVWRPWPDVEIHTELTDHFPWHLRLHTIASGRRLETAEGAFATPREEEGITSPINESSDSRGALYKGSGILNIEGDRIAILVEPLPSTNIIHPRTTIPTLTGTLLPGTHRLACIVLGERDPVKARTLWASPPNVDELLRSRNYSDL